MMHPALFVKDLYSLVLPLLLGNCMHIPYLPCPPKTQQPPTSLYSVPNFPQIVFPTWSVGPTTRGAPQTLTLICQAVSYTLTMS